MELITIIYADNGTIEEVEQLDCAICGGDHSAEDCPDAWR